jgi:hypothetical protein
MSSLPSDVLNLSRDSSPSLVRSDSSEEADWRNDDEDKVGARKRLKAKYECLDQDQIDDEIQIQERDSQSDHSSYNDSSPGGDSPLPQADGDELNLEEQLKQDEAVREKEREDYRAIWLPLPANIRKLAASLGPLPKEVPRIEHDAKIWSDLLETEGYEPFLKSVMQDEEMANGKVPDGVMLALLRIAASMHLQILSLIMHGNLALAYKTKYEIRRTLDSIRQRSGQSPGIYWQGLCNDQGISPTPNEIRKIVESVETYCEHSNDADALAFAYGVDTFKYKKLSKSDTKKGYRHYLKGDSEKTRQRQNYDSSPDPTQKLKVLAWCKMVRVRIDSMDPLEQDKPLAMPLCEIGYSWECLERLTQHKNHQSSNYVMNLCEAVCSMLYHRGALSKNYHMLQFVIFNCWEPAQGILAELFFTRVGHGYIFNGGGFSHYPAGLSNDSVMTRFPDFTVWERLKRYAIQYSPYEQNLKWQNARIKAGLKGIEATSAEKKRKAEETLETSMKDEWEREQNEEAERNKKFARTKSADQRLKEATEAVFEKRFTESERDLTFLQGYE